MEGQHHGHHNPLQQQQQKQLHHHHHPQHQQPISVNVDTDRLPQWSLQETKEFLMMRAELDRSFMETKRNKLLWEVISTRMREKGYNRSAEQCKCKWKNLFTRYKGCETGEAEAMRQQFPFYNELQAIISARMQGILWSEGGGGGASTTTRSKKKAMQLSSDEELEDTEEHDELEKGSVRKKKKGKLTGGSTSVSSSSNNNNIKEILEDFMRQQMQMEMQWREAFEARENERRLKEMEWRQTMEALENERIIMDRRWREREEQRRMREEARAEERDALITALLNKLRRDDHM